MAQTVTTVIQDWQEYPKWKYLAGNSRLVNSAAEEVALGGWGDSPDFGIQEEVGDVPVEAPKRRGRPPKVSDDA